MVGDWGDTAARQVALMCGVSSRGESHESRLVIHVPSLKDDSRPRKICSILSLRSINFIVGYHEDLPVDSSAFGICSVSRSRNEAKYQSSIAIATPSLLDSGNVSSFYLKLELSSAIRIRQKLYFWLSSFSRLFHPYNSLDPNIHFFAPFFAPFIDTRKFPISISQLNFLHGHQHCMSLSQTWDRTSLGALISVVLLETSF